jgi:hypothetical protein
LETIDTETFLQPAHLAKVFRAVLEYDLINKAKTYTRQVVAAELVVRADVDRTMHMTEK